MPYTKENKIKTAENLQDLRKSKGLSYMQLSKELKVKLEVSISHTSLKEYEQTDDIAHKSVFDKNMNIANLVALADFYDVSFDFLLGRSRYRTRENVNIGEYLGLSDKSIQKIQSIQNTQQYKFKDYFNDILEQISLQSLLMYVDSYTKIKDLKASPEQQKLHNEYNRKLLEYAMDHRSESAANSDELNRMQEQINQEHFIQRGIIGKIHDLLDSAISKMYYRVPKEEKNGEHHEADK